MLNLIKNIISFFIFSILVLSLGCFFKPNYEESFVRETLVINDGLDISEVVVVDLMQNRTKWLEPKNGYFFRFLNSNAPLDLIDKFREYPIPRIRRGYVKHWSKEKNRAQIEVNKILELDRNKASVRGRILYPRGIYENFYYVVRKENGLWVVVDRSINFKGKK